MAPPMATWSFIFLSGWGRVLTKVGPETSYNGSGSKDDADRIQNWPRKSIMFRDNLLVTSTRPKFQNGCLTVGNQRDPAVFLWPSVFLEAWGTKA